MEKLYVVFEGAVSSLVRSEVSSLLVTERRLNTKQRSFLLERSSLLLPRKSGEGPFSCLRRVLEHEVEDLSFPYPGGRTRLSV